MYVSSFHSVSLCFVTSIFQIIWSVTSCFRDFPLYLIRFICYETEMGLLKKKDVCFIVSFRFTLFRNEHISNCLVCYILFQRFSSIFSSFHLLRNRNGFIKKSICFIVTLRYTLFRNKHWPRCLNCFILFCNKWNEWNRPSVRTAIGLFHLFHSFSVHFRVFLIYFNCFICFCYGENNVPKKNLRGFCAVYEVFWRITIAWTITVEDHQGNISTKLYWHWSSGVWQEDF